MKKENDTKVVEIAKVIGRHRELESTVLFTENKNLAIALSNIQFQDQGEDENIWITNKENVGGYHVVRNIVGTITGAAEGNKTTITEDGKVVYKNSRLGGLLIQNTKGKHEFATPKGQLKLTIKSLSTYTPNGLSEEASDLVININERKARRYQSLKEILTSIQEVDEKIEELEEERKQLSKDTAHAEREDEILKRIEAEKLKREKSINQAQNFIRKNAELRYQPILDPWQEEVKRSCIFEGTVAIDGGPGTGKTTSLIQRIKFLIDKNAMLGTPDNNGKLEDGYLPNLTKSKKEKLFESQQSWIFFTPNELLKLFLENNMTQEGLLANNKTVKIWDNHLNHLVKQYKLVNTETQNPFLFLRDGKEESILPHSAKNLERIINDFKAFYLNYLNEQLSKLTEIDSSPFFWKQEGQSIQNYINRQDKDYNIQGLIKLYFNIQETFSSSISHRIEELNTLLTVAGAKFLRMIEDQPQQSVYVMKFIEDWMQGSSNVEEEENEEEEEEIVEDNFSKDAFLLGKLKILLKNHAMGAYDITSKISSRYKELLNLVSPIIDITEYQDYNRIGQLGYFSKYFARSTRGIVSNIFSQIPQLYKAFRRMELKEKKNEWNFKLLNYIVKEDNAKNKRLHPEEQSLLIYIINEIINLSYNQSIIKTKAINHPYFQAYREYTIPVIGVDEATDFHLIDLMAIHSLSDPEISSVTYSGDLMQRLTKVGIRNWSELSRFIKKFEVKELAISYRQSPTLLDVASSIYQMATSKEAQYISFSDPDEKEPKPLWFESEDEMEQIEWIGERIFEIYKAYGKLIPSIAIFMPSEEMVSSFAKRLGQIDKLADVGINVKACNNGEVLGDNNTVRVFSIDYVKGLEFEAVFFHKIDSLLDLDMDADLVIRNLYVGLSRASFYLGVTSNSNSTNFKELKELFQTKNTNWKL